MDNVSLDANRPVWDSRPWPGFGRLEHDLETDVCVIGLGGSGLACIHELLRLGQNVVGLDAASVAGGAAGRNGGLLIAGTAAFYHDAVARLGRKRVKAIYALTLAEIARMKAETPALVRRVGSLRIASSAEEVEDCQRQLGAMRADGLPAAPYEGSEGRGLLFEQDAVFHPLERCRTLARSAQGAGALLFEHSPALSVKGHKVETPGGRVRCKRAIVAVDGGLARLLPELNPRLRSVRLQMLATAPVPDLILPRPVYARYGYEYWQQLPDGRLALGGFRDRGGEAEYTEDSRPSERIQEALEHFLREGLGVTEPITHRWAASVSYTNAILPIFEEVRAGVFALGGYNGTGNLLGSLLGRAAARWAVLGDRGLSPLFI